LRYGCLVAIIKARLECDRLCVHTVIIAAEATSSRCVLTAEVRVVDFSVAAAAAAPCGAAWSHVTV